MISAHDVAARDADRQRIAAQVAEYERLHGPIVTRDASDYDHQSITERLTEKTRDGWDNRMSDARKKLLEQRARK